MDIASYEAAQRTVPAGYRLQLTLTDLADLALQIQHIRWNLSGAPFLKYRLDDLEALCRASADAVAARMAELVYRVSQFGDRVRESQAILDRTDPASAEVLRAISMEFAAWPPNPETHAEYTASDE